MVLSETLRSLFAVSKCRVDGKVYRESDSFVTDVDGCAKCVCVIDGVKCDASKCQEFAIKRAMNNKAGPQFNDYTVIKNQLTKQYFAEYDAVRLKILTDALGCKTTDCPQLIAASKIEYSVLNLNRQEYIGRADKQNKIVIHSTDAEAVNNSPSKQEVTTVGYSIKATQYYEATVTKTTEISSNAEINLKFLKFGAAFKFGRTTSETRKSSNETTLNAPSQRIVVDPYSKINVTFNFYQYDDINNYFLDFEISNDTTITHPEVNANSVVVFDKKPLFSFLQNQIDFLPTLKYEKETDIKIVSRDGKFVLTNFPATEKLTNFGVDVVFGKPEEIPH